MTDYTAPSMNTTGAALAHMAQIDAAARTQTAERAAKAPNAAVIEDRAREFEATFVAEMIKPMFETVGVNSMFGGGKGEEIFRGLMVQEYGKKITQAGGIGLAEKVKAELLRIQEETKKH